VNRARNLDLDLAQERLRDRARSDEHRGVSRARALERVTRVLEAVLQRAGEVGVAGPRQSHRLRSLSRRLSFRRPGAHPPRPVLVVAVLHDERERSSERAAVAETGEDLDSVLLDLLPWTSSVALLAPPQVGVDRLPVDHEAGRQSGHDRNECGPVRLAGRDDGERHGAERTAFRITSSGAEIPVQRSNDSAPWRTSTSSPSITVAPAVRVASAVALSG
jgi:hypothetical protein